MAFTSSYTPGLIQQSEYYYGTPEMTPGLSGSFSGSFQGDGSALTNLPAASTPTLQQVTTAGNITDQGLIVTGSTIFKPISSGNGGAIELTNVGYSGLDNPIMTFKDGQGNSNIILGHRANDGQIQIYDQPDTLRTVLSANFSAFDPGSTTGNGIYFGLTSSMAPTSTNGRAYIKMYEASYSGAPAYNFQLNNRNYAAGSGTVGLYGIMSTTSTAAPAIQITSINSEKVVNFGGPSFIHSNGKQNNYLKYGLQIGGGFTGTNANMPLTDGSLIMSGSGGSFSMKSVSSEAEIKTNAGATTLTLGTTSSFTAISASSYISASNFIGDGSQLTNLPSTDPFPFSGDAVISGSTTITGSLNVFGGIRQTSGVGANVVLIGNNATLGTTANAEGAVSIGDGAFADMKAIGIGEGARAGLDSITIGAGAGNGTATGRGSIAIGINARPNATAISSITLAANDQNEGTLTVSEPKTFGVYLENSNNNAPDLKFKVGPGGLSYWSGSGYFGFNTKTPRSALDVRGTISGSIISGSHVGDGSGLTNLPAASAGSTAGRVVFTTTNGELTSEAGFTYDATTDRLTIPNLTTTTFTASFITSSTIETSGSNIFGDEAGVDVQTLIGTTRITGSAQITGSTSILGDTQITGSLKILPTANVPVKIYGAGASTIVGFGDNSTRFTFSSTGTATMVGFKMYSGILAGTLDGGSQVINKLDRLELGGYGFGGTSVIGMVSPAGTVTVPGNGFAMYPDDANGAGTVSPHFKTENGSILTLATTSSLKRVISDSSKISGSGGLTVESSGSTVFEVIGSQGTLFSIDDDLDGTLLNVKDRSGIPVLQASASGEIFLGQSPQSLYTTAVISSTTADVTQSLYGLDTSSYGGAFFDYIAHSGSNARGGTVSSVWTPGGSVVFSETTTTHIGDTSNLNLVVHFSQSQAQLAYYADTDQYNIKIITRAI